MGGEVKQNKQQGQTQNSVQEAAFHSVKYFLTMAPGDRAKAGIVKPVSDSLPHCASVLMSPILTPVIITITQTHVAPLVHFTG
jgi:hypothetical protein